MAHGAAHNQQHDKINLNALIGIVWRCRLLMTSLLLIIVSLTAIILSFIDNQYTAETSFIIEERDARESAVSAVAIETNTKISLLNEVEIIRSRLFAGRVVRELDLLSDPLFSKSLKREETETKSEESPFKSLSLYKSDISKLPRNVLTSDIENAVTILLRRMNVHIVPGTQVIKVEFENQDPKKAASMANNIVRVYRHYRLDESKDTIRRNVDFLDKQLKQAKEQLIESEEEFAKFLTDNNLGPHGQAPSQKEKLSLLNTQLAAEENKRRDLQARIDQLYFLADSPEKIAAASDVVRSPFIQNLRKDETDLLAQITERSARFGKRHPEMIRLNTALSELRDKMRREMIRIIETLENDLGVIKTKIDSIDLDIAVLVAQDSGKADLVIQLDLLQRDIAANRELYTTSLTAYKKASAQLELLESDITVLSYAIPPQYPSYPNHPLILSLSAILALFAGLGLSVLLETFNSALRSPGQLEDLYGPALFCNHPASRHKQKGDNG